MLCWVSGAVANDAISHASRIQPLPSVAMSNWSIEIEAVSTNRSEISRHTCYMVQHYTSWEKYETVIENLGKHAHSIGFRFAKAAELTGVDTLSVECMPVVSVISFQGTLE